MIKDSAPPMPLVAEVSDSSDHPSQCKNGNSLPPTSLNTQLGYLNAPWQQPARQALLKPDLLWCRLLTIPDILISTIANKHDR